MVGTTISHYRVLQQLGAGGMGVVYLADDLRLNRKVALKFIGPDARDDHAADRLRREARAGGALDHPHIATVYEIDEWEGRAFVAMAYYQGETLRARLESGPVPIDDAIAIVGQIAEGLAAAHAAGIVHRDLKPANVLLTSSGQVKILDFGLAKFVADDLETAAAVTRVGTVVGTLAYMSPEQAQGLTVDARTDIWALGVLTYELVAGRRPFDSATTAGLALAVATSPPPPIRTLRPDVPIELENTIAAALEKDPAKRTITASEIVAAMHALRDRRASPPATARLRSRRAMAVVAIAAVAMVAAGVAVVRYIQGRSEQQWARSEALKEITALAEQERYIDAVDLAERVRPHHDEATFARILQPLTRPMSITTVPDGAEVSYAAYGVDNPEWHRLGTTPIASRRVPRGLMRWKIEKAGHDIAEDVSVLPSMRATLPRAGTSPPGMVPVAASGDPVTFLVQGVQLPPMKFGDYWIGRHEVTNREFKAFLDAGGYSTETFWKHGLSRDGKAADWKTAVARFVDATGRPGPASWEVGRYPAGQDDLPVTGISWYEAAAYADFVGGELPTLYHWNYVAAIALLTRQVFPRAIFSRPSPLPVGTSGARHRFGAFDLAGNVKEWSVNAADGDRRYTLGGGFDEPAYMIGTADPRSAWDRAANIGFRVVKHDGADPALVALRAAVPRAVNPPLPAPVGAEVFAAYVRSFAYDRTPLADVVKAPPDATPQDWIRETVSFPAPYGQERVVVHVLLPKAGEPPYQPVIYLPGGDAWQLPNSREAVEAPQAAFVVRSGRALIVPIVKGTYERADGLIPDTTLDSSKWRDTVVGIGKDVSRTIDYLATRSDLALDRLGYIGSSRSGAFGPVFLAIEPRIKAAVFWVPGFHRARAQPEVHPINFAPHMRQPVLILNGRYDAIFPEDSAQLPFLRALGTPEALKRRIVYDSGHNLPVNERIKETIAWFDRHLGPVR